MVDVQRKPSVLEVKSLAFLPACLFVCLFAYLLIDQ